MKPALFSSLKALCLLSTFLTLAGCTASSPQPASVPVSACPPTPECPACPTCPTLVEPKETPPPAQPLQRASWTDIPGWQEDTISDALPALQSSCSVTVRQPRWSSFCADLQSLPNEISQLELRRFLESRLEPWAIVKPDGSKNGLITGYYEPLIRGSRERSEGYDWPIHAPPSDMLTVDLTASHPELRHLRLRGRQDGNRIVPYWTRAELLALGDQLPASILGWAADPIDLFFLHVQGSGQIELPDGSRMRIGYADQNGHPYQSIGRWLIAQGELTLDQASMEGIKNWAKENPDRLEELLNQNPSYVFFRELNNHAGGPIGALSVPLTEGRSLAIDPSIIPLGTPVFLATTFPLSDTPLRRLMAAQDTGSAIKGAARGDFFWGFGVDAGAQAGRMRQEGQMWALLPRD